MDLSLIENELAILSRPTGVSAYDFDFGLHFECRHPYRLDREYDGILRIGAPADYAACYREAIELGIRPINDPDQHRIASQIEYWYPSIAEMTPKTRVFDALPEADRVEAEFGWPVFLKGSRQTSKHNPDLAIIENREHYARAVAAYGRDPILHWQKPVLREFVALAPIGGSIPAKSGLRWNSGPSGCTGDASVTARIGIRFPPTRANASTMVSPWRTRSRRAFRSRSSSWTSPRPKMGAGSPSNATMRRNRDMQAFRRIAYGVRFSMRIAG